MAGSFGKADVARDDGAEEAVFEVLAEGFSDLLGEVGAVIVHGEQYAFDGELGVEGSADPFEVGDEFGDAFEGEVFGLHGDDEAVRGGEGVEREQIERGGAVEDDEVEAVEDGSEGVAKTRGAVVFGSEFDVGSGEVFAAGEEGEMFDLGGKQGLFGGGAGGEEIVDGEPLVVAGKAEAGGAVGLGVAVDEENALAKKGEACGEIDGGGGFADSTFLVDDPEDFAHGLTRVHGWSAMGKNRIESRSWPGLCGRSETFHVEHFGLGG